MAKVNNLEGAYSIEGNQLVKEGLTLQIADRKKVSVTKPLHFLRAIRPQFEYISSMYQVDSGKYEIDYSGKKYLVIVSDSTAKIEAI